MSATRAWPLIAIATIIPTLAVCDARRPEPAENPRPAGALADRPTPRTSTEAAVTDSLAIELESPAEVAAGETVRMAIRLRNITEGAIHLHLLGREIAFDLVVRDAGGAVVWERLEGETVMAILRLETLEAGEALELVGTWDQRSSDGDRVPPGDYTAQGSVPTEGPEPLRTPVVPLRISSPG